MKTFTKPTFVRLEVVKFKLLPEYELNFHTFFLRRNTFSARQPTNSVKTVEFSLVSFSSRRKPISNSKRAKIVDLQTVYICLKI